MSLEVTRARSMQRLIEPGGTSTRDCGCIGGSDMDCVSAVIIH
ncbi:MAG TPA: hypothetical protein VK325_03155 [Pseudoxanthomonas sp.]|nr:hypothetical protein [Pseudoxanthomonas sp.]